MTVHCQFCSKVNTIIFSSFFSLWSAIRIYWSSYERYSIIVAALFSRLVIRFRKWDGQTGQCLICVCVSIIRSFVAVWEGGYFPDVAGVQFPQALQLFTWRHHVSKTYPLWFADTQDTHQKLRQRWSKRNETPHPHPPKKSFFFSSLFRRWHDDRF